jgi:hypothetical protein
MGKIASDETKEIAEERWGEWCDLFTNGNRGRLIGIEILDDESGAQNLADGVALVAIDHDPEGKGNDMVISYGDEEAPSHHTVAGPVALWQAQDRNGVVVSLEVENEHGGGGGPRKRSKPVRPGSSLHAGPAGRAEGWVGYTASEVVP